MTAEKKTFWNTPIPESIMNGIKALLPENIEREPRSSRGVRRLLGVCAAVSLVLIWITEGFVNPLEYLVDLPALTYEAIIDVFPGYETYYYAWLLSVTAVMMTLLKQFICGDEEYPIWTVNGILFWVVGLAVAILADAVTRNVVMERFMIPVLERGGGVFSADGTVLLSLLIMQFFLYFAIEDFSGNCMAAMVAPFVLRTYDTYVVAGGLMAIPLVRLLVLTFGVKLALIVLEKLGVTGFLSDLLIKYLYTPKYIPFAILVALALPLLPFFYIRYLVRRDKEKEET